MIIALPPSDGPPTAANKPILLDFVKEYNELLHDREFPKMGSIHLRLLWLVYSTIYEIGEERAFQLVEMGILLTGLHERTHIFAHRASVLVKEIGHMTDETISTIQDQRDAYFAFCYVLLQKRKITHAEAAEFAAEAIGKEYTTEAWRVALGRWIERMGLERVGQRRPKA